MLRVYPAPIEPIAQQQNSERRYWGQIGVKKAGQLGQRGNLGQAAKPGNLSEPLQVRNFVELLGLGAEGRRSKPGRPDHAAHSSA